MIMQMAHIDSVELVKAAHTSNMTKIYPLDIEMRNHLFAQSDYRDEPVTWKFAETGYVCIRKSDGKALKCPAYTEADFGTFAKQIELISES